jgi:archaemetzincin
LLVPIGEITPSLLDYLVLQLERRLGRTCRRRLGVPLDAGAYDALRGQSAADALVRRLDPGCAERILGVADVDLNVASLNFVFGQADPIARRAIVSTQRLREAYYGRPEDENLLRLRALKECDHELGHTYGLGHCSNHRCVMAFSNSLADTDLKGSDLCTRCRARFSRRAGA